MKERLSVSEERNIITGEAITLTAVMAICAVAIVAVVCYRIFMSEKGQTSLPGGWRFVWN